MDLDSVEEGNGVITECTTPTTGHPRVSTPTQDSGEGTSVTWRPSPNTGRKRAAVQQVHPESEIHGLEEALANVNAKVKNKRFRSSSREETKGINNEDYSWTRQLLQSWLSTSGNPDENSPARIISSTWAKEKQFAQISNLIENGTNPEAAQAMMAISSVQSANDGKLMEILEQLESNIQVEGTSSDPRINYSSNTISAVRSVSAVKQVRPRGADLQQLAHQNNTFRSSQKPAHMMPPQSTKTITINMPNTAGSSKPVDRFLEQKLRAKALRERKRAEAMNRTRAQAQGNIGQPRPNIQRCVFPRANQIPVRPNLPGTTSYVPYGNISTEKHAAVRSGAFQRQPLPQRTNSSSQNTDYKRMMPAQHPSNAISVSSQNLVQVSSLSQSIQSTGSCSHGITRLNGGGKVVETKATIAVVPRGSTQAQETVQTINSAHPVQNSKSGNHSEANPSGNFESVPRNNITGAIAPIESSMSAPGKYGLASKSEESSSSTGAALGPSSCANIQTNLSMGADGGSSVDDYEFNLDEAFLAAMCMEVAKYDHQAPMATGSSNASTIGTVAAGHVPKINTINNDLKSRYPQSDGDTTAANYGLLAECSGSCAKQGETYSRFKVVGVTRAIQQQHQVVILDLLTRPGNELQRAELRDGWIDTQVQVGDHVNIVYTTGKNPFKGGRPRGVPIVIDQEQHFLILCPDLLVSPTRITGAVQCLRRAVLAEQVQAYIASKYTAMGNAKHELIERALIPSGCGEVNSAPAKPNFDRQYLEAAVNDIVRDESIVEQLFVAGCSEATAKRELLQLIPSLQKWASNSLKDCGAQAGTLVNFGGGRTTSFLIDKIVATEEKVWSPMWGLKGQMDIMTYASVKESKSHVAANFHPDNPAKGSKGMLVPLEIKTGHRIKTEHHAQVSLYSLLVADRYRGFPICGDSQGPMSHGAGVLLHMGQSRNERYTNAQDSNSNSSHGCTVTFEGVRHARMELVELIKIRNNFAVSCAPSWMRGGKPQMAITEDGDLDIPGASDEVEKMNSILDQAPLESQFISTPKDDEIVQIPLPPVVGNRKGECSRCYQKEVCMLYHAALEDGTAQSSGLNKEDFESIVGYLSKPHLDYFRKWNLLLDLEAGCSAGYQREIWTLTSKERETRGRCVGNMKLVSSEWSHSNDESGTRTYLHRFQRHTKSNSMQTMEDSRTVESITDQDKPQTPSKNMKKSHLTQEDIDEDDDFDLIPISDLHFDVGDYVAVSIEDSHVAMMSGRIETLSNDQVSVRSSHALRLPEDGHLGTLKWRIDKDEMLTGLRLVKNNLVQLFVGSTKANPEDDDERLGDVRTRELVVDLATPRFVDDDYPQGSRFLRDNIELPATWWSGTKLLEDMVQSQEHGDLHSSNTYQHQNQQLLEYQKDMEQKYISLNSDQRRAVSAVLAAKDYVCIEGMPGTGKTTTLAFIARALYTLGKSVLICAYTHTAVDNVLLKLKENAVPFVRLGRSAQIHPALRSDTLAKYTAQSGETLSVGVLNRMVTQKRLIIGTTCLGVRHPLLLKRRFDYCIVDEAGQLTQPVCLGPLRISNTFVLVGDLQQLPPLVRSSRAKEFGMDTSLFKRLSEAHPQATTQLTLQFRMNEQIMSLANRLVYENRLTCGNAMIASRVLTLSHFPQGLPSPMDSANSHWLQSVVDPSRPVVFVDTDAVYSNTALEIRTEMKINEKQSGKQGSGSESPQKNNKAFTEPCRGRLINKIEAQLSRLVVDGFVKCGLMPVNIGVISPYRSQLRVLRRYLNDHLPELEIQTVDKYQGRDKMCIIVSLVRSNLERNVGTLLCDWRRINVAFTRAMCKLVIIGSKTTLETSPVFSKFLQLVSERQWIVELPQKAHEVYGRLDMLSPGRTSRVPISPDEVRIPGARSSNPILRNIATEINSAYDRRHEQEKMVSNKVGENSGAARKTHRLDTTW